MQTEIRCYKCSYIVIIPAPQRVNCGNQYQLPGALDVPKRPLRWGKWWGWEPKPGIGKFGAAGIWHHLCRSTAAAMPRATAMPRADGGTTLNRKKLQKQAVWKQLQPWHQWIASADVFGCLNNVNCSLTKSMLFNFWSAAFDKSETELLAFLDDFWKKHMNCDSQDKHN